jgi:hypothetical protein
MPDTREHVVFRFRYEDGTENDYIWPIHEWPLPERLEDGSGGWWVKVSESSLDKPVQGVLRGVVYARAPKRVS